MRERWKDSAAPAPLLRRRQGLASGRQDERHRDPPEAPGSLRRRGRTALRAQVDPFAVVKLEPHRRRLPWLKEAPGLEMDFLERLTAVDWPGETSSRSSITSSPSPPARHRPQGQPTGRTRLVDRPGPASGRPPTGSSARSTTCSASDSTATPTCAASCSPTTGSGSPLRKDYQEPVASTGSPTSRETRSSSCAASTSCASPSTLKATRPPPPPPPPPAPPPGPPRGRAPARPPAPSTPPAAPKA